MRVKVIKGHSDEIEDLVQQFLTEERPREIVSVTATPVLGSARTLIVYMILWRPDLTPSDG